MMNQTCKIGLWNQDVPGISFEEDGICNYANIQKKLMALYPRGIEGKAAWEKIVKKIKIKMKHNSHDCIVGVSGGVDSSYLLYLAKEIYGLRPLAVTVDNGWNSDIAVKNIKLLTDKLEIDLETYVIDYEEVKDLLRSYMFAGIPWIDIPTDIAIKSVMYKTALSENIKYIFRGNDFRTEGKQPREWTYSDHRQITYIHKKFGNLKKMRSFPFLPFYKIIYSGLIKGIKDIRPYYYLDYSKKDAKMFLQEEFGWKYYGGHHHENVFTKFAMSYWLPKKFNIDKRIINLSAQIISGEISRDFAINELKKSPISDDEGIELKRYVLKKLDFSEEEFNNIMLSDNKTYRDYPNYEKNLFLIMKYFNPMIKLVYTQKPMSFVEMEYNKK